jgi:hypothetical protein
MACCVFTAICRTVVIVPAEIGGNFGQLTIELWFDNNRRPPPITPCCMSTVMQIAVMQTMTIACLL